MPIHDWTRVNAGIFHDFHHEWISTIKHALNDGLLPAGYYALAEQIAGGLHPDLLTLGSSNPHLPGTNGSVAPGGDGAGSVAVEVSPPAVSYAVVAEVEQYANKRNRVVIRHISDDPVVAMIEIVSPGNKASRHAFRSFVAKAIELLNAGIHLLIVDLHPPGPRDPQGIHEAIWSEVDTRTVQLPADRPLTLVSYSAGTRLAAYIEPTAVGLPLRPMPLFLQHNIYVNVPLEETYLEAFTRMPRRWRDVLEPPAAS